MEMERRKFSRVEFSTQGELHNACYKWDISILDLSINGAMIEEPEDFNNMSSTMKLDILLPDSEEKISTLVSVIRKNNGFIGLEFQSIPVDSIVHLRRLLDLNLGDESIVKAELTYLINK